VYCPTIWADFGLVGDPARSCWWAVTVMSRQRCRTIAQNIALLFGSSLFCFFVIEMGYRVLDPFPFFSRDEINHTEHGNLSTYDQALGWKGVPGGTAEFVTENNRVWLAHNGYGFRDIEHKDSNDKKPAIVFLGDSFTWGYEVEFGEMFVNQLRDRLPSYEIFNLAHRGYGTDQEFLTFTRWRDNRPLKFVILMFSENDVEDNNSSVRYTKPKPQYQLVENELVLTGVPVPKIEDWTHSRPAEMVLNSWRTKLKKILFRSHFLHVIYFRYSLFRSSNKGNRIRKDGKGADLTLTSRILEELKKEVERRGAKLVVFFIPSKREIERLDDSLPYQIEIADLCQKRGIEYFDLASDFKTSWYRTYYRHGGHWNSRGHQVAAEAMYTYLTRDVSP